MSFQDKIKKVQVLLKEEGIDGWLLYDFRFSNDLACNFLEISPDKMLTRRLWYWIPQEGEAVKLVHRVESNVLDHLPGAKVPYHPWKQMEQELEKLLSGCSKVAMEYSPRNAIPYVSKVDAGTVEMVRSFGVEVVTSAAILQGFSSVLTEEQIATHHYAEKVVDEAVAAAWELIGTKLEADERITEYEVQQFILSKFREAGCENHGDPIVGVNGNAADPHYAPSKDRPVQIKKGDFILIDLWCRKAEPKAIYADITRVGVAAAEPTARQIEVFEIVREARDAGIELVNQRFNSGLPVRGYEVDQAVRDVIEAAGYGQYFTHRTGHSITTKDHGEGAHIDNLETQDERQILPGTCFSIEPGIYIPGEIGVRLEINMLISHAGEPLVTGGLQTEIECLLGNGAMV